MEREIKFKAKVVGEDKWTYSNGFLKFVDGTITIIVDDSGSDYCKTSPIQPGTLKQFTGFSDDFNFEIYEDDFIEIGPGNNILVKFENGSWIFIYNSGSIVDKDYLFEAVKKSKLKLIGNTIDNPELLTNNIAKNIWIEEAGEIDKEAYSKLTKRKNNGK